MTNPKIEGLPPEPTVDFARLLTYAHCLSASLQLAEKTGRVEVNPSIIKAVENVQELAIKGFDLFTALKLAKFCAKAGDTALAQLDAPNEETRCLAIAYAILKSVEDQQMASQSTLAVTALGIVMEAETEDDPVWKRATRPKYYADKFYHRAAIELRYY
jgi:hypothetical protein